MAKQFYDMKVTDHFIMVGLLDVLIVVLAQGEITQLLPKQLKYGIIVAAKTQIRISQTMAKSIGHILALGS